MAPNPNLLTLRKLVVLSSNPNQNSCQPKEPVNPRVKSSPKKILILSCQVAFKLEYANLDYMFSTKA